MGQMKIEKTSVKTIKYKCFYSTYVETLTVEIIYLCQKYYYFMFIREFTNSLFLIKIQSKKLWKILY